MDAKSATATQDPNRTDQSASHRRPLSEAAARFAEPLALPVIWIIAIVVFGALRPSTFLTHANFSAMFSSQTGLVVLALALVLPLTAGQYDLSVGSVAGLSSMIIAVLNAQHHVPIVLSIVIALICSGLVGVINAIASVFAGVDSLIVTLGMGTLLQGAVSWIGHSNVVSGVSNTLINLVVVDKFLGVPLEFWYGIVLCVLVWLFLGYVPLGRRLLIVGRGKEVARLSGIRVNAIKAGSLVSSSILGGVAGILIVGTSGSADPTTGPLLLLPAFAAVFLGATTISPGRFNAWGALVAVLFLVTGYTGLQQIGAQTYIQDIFYGAALIIAVVFSHLLRRRRS